MKISKNIIIIGSVVILIIIGIILYFVFGTGGSSSSVSVQAKTGDITESVNLTGQVKASEGVDLAF
jgi:multidrug efflux pump subunit AcrA (membrane-fusion protein)